MPALKYQLWVNSTEVCGLHLSGLLLAELLTNFGCIYPHSLLRNTDDALAPIFCLHIRKAANVSHKQREEKACCFPEVSKAVFCSYLQAVYDPLNAWEWKGMDTTCSQSTFLGYSQKLSWEEPGNTF